MIRRAFTYFALVFGLGFVLGTMRVLWVVPLLGERMAELAEAPMMLAGIFYAARFSVGRNPAVTLVGHLRSGLIALGLVVALEFSVVLSLRGLTLSEYFATRDPLSVGVYVALLLTFAFMPWAIARWTKVEAA